MTSPPTITLRQQLATCLLLAALAAAIIGLSRFFELGATHFPGLGIGYQCLAGAVLGLGMAAVSYAGYRAQAHKGHVQDMIDSYSRLDLRGMNPIWISLAAGISEEVLFRAALQPLLGLWLASAVFVLAHARAYRFWPLNRAACGKVLGLFAGSVFFGLVFAYLGLLTATLCHTIADAAALLTIQSVQRRRALERAGQSCSPEVATLA